MNFSSNSSAIYDSQQLEEQSDNLSFNFETDSTDFYEIFDQHLNFDSRQTLKNFSCFCSKLFISQYGRNLHTNMYHPTQSVICTDCQMSFRSHRALKTHQQRSHSSAAPTLTNYNHLSSYLVVAFSSELFPVICAKACLEKRLPLGELSSKLFLCSNCHISFPCSRTLKYHQLSQHEIHESEQTSYEKTNQLTDEFQSVQNDFAQLAPHFGLTLKQNFFEKYHRRESYNAQIYPQCSHSGRTCANLCLHFLPSYEKHLQNYAFKISLVPKGNPFSHGSIISKLPIRLLANDVTTTATSNIISASPKRKTIKRIGSSMSDISLSVSTKKKLIEPANKLYDTSSKSTVVNTKKTQTKNGQFHARSLSSNNLSSKRSRSPIIRLAVERSAQKRKRQREQRKTLRETSPVSVELNSQQNDTDIEQENGDDDDVHFDRSHKPKERQDSTGSIEYIQTLNNDSENNQSLNNIENFKQNSPPSPKKLKTSTTTVTIQTNDDEHIRVRCKVCGDILEGRSLFSKHVLTMHSHLVNKTISNRQQQTAVVR